MSQWRASVIIDDRRWVRWSRRQAINGCRRGRCERREIFLVLPGLGALVLEPIGHALDSPIKIRSVR